MRFLPLKKCSSLVVFLLLSLMLFPILAFAADLWIGDVSYDKSNGTVTASVYSSVYDGSAGGVVLNVYGPGGGGNPISTVSKSTYDSKITVGSATYYKFNFQTTVTAGTYDPIYLQAAYGSVSSSVYGAVYGTVSTPPNNGGGGSSGGGGGSGGGSGSSSGGGGTDSGNSIVGSDGKADAGKLEALLKANPAASLSISGSFVILPASALQSGHLLTIVSGDASYSLPLDKLNLSGLAGQLGVEIKDLNIRVDITSISGDDAKPIDDAIAQVSGAERVSGIFDFSITAIGPDGKTVPVDFGGTYLSRTIKLTTAADAGKMTGVTFHSGQISFVPSKFSGSEATLMRNGNSIYTVIRTNGISFDDIVGHWAQPDIELLANKLVVDGVTPTQFQPERSITRAEFAALAVRALGIEADSAALSGFSDVSSADWFNGVVAAAAKAGLVDGYPDGTFRPNAPITREELAAMVVRSLRYAGLDTSVSGSEQTALLAQFEDSNRIVWAQSEIAEAINAGLMNGMTDKTLEPAGMATRAQAATMLKRLLEKRGFIN